MDASLLSKPASAALSVGQSLGEVLDVLSAVKPFSIDFPTGVLLLRTCGDGAIASLRDGKVVLITVSPTPMSYLLSSENPHTAEVSILTVSSDYQMAMSGTRNGELKLWSVAEKREIATLEEHTKGMYTCIRDLSTCVYSYDDNSGLQTGHFSE